MKIKGTINVLLVEDNPGDALIIDQMFKQIHKIQSHIIHAKRLSEGLEALDSHDFHIILLDLQLPDSQGLDTFNQVHDVAPDIPIIILTGLEDENFAIDIMGEGAQDYLVKGEVDSKLLWRSITYSIERKHIEQRLRESEEKYRLIVEKIHSGIFFVDSNNKLTYVNKQMAKMLGFTAKEMINQDISCFTNPDGESCFKKHLKMAKKGKSLEKSAYIYELELLNKEQTSVWVLVSTNPMFNSAGEYLGAISIMTDISSRKGIEKSLMETIIEKDRDFFLVMGNMVEAMKPLIQNSMHSPFEYNTKLT
ncbi:MAG: two-component system, NarL family, sensor histidine kinase UhpB [Methanobacterium sp.]|jgi:two-component system sensor histidine kinase UhpB|uniref:PAS domain-containing response regulator n=1 Tax=Methanobacterium sp. TaxID=2164 RepID=UPI0003C99848|nr:PAS domain S-box protein [Methanobacterium sp.]MDI3550037.1 two-component system, NarL family, sensor histidine kinase UhpB [Methanobacterium sp.]CDG64973.1 putative PAS/PAC sensor protein [Methanobacterium sp. MB1]